MSGSGSRRAEARADKVIPGIWRLRVPLPWPATPHGNAYAIASDGGVVLFDTGYGGPQGRADLESALRQAGFGLADVKLIACTHAHSDHAGCAASIASETGCPIWIHPAWEHMRGWIEDPDATLTKRLEDARRNGVPATVLERWEAERRGSPPGIDGPLRPDRDLVDGSEVETDLGIWRTHFTPGHAPSHVVLHQPDRRLLVSGDLIVGGIFLYFDHGHTPDPVGEFLSSLDTVAELDVGLCLSGHGRPFRSLDRRIEANRAEVERQLEGVRSQLEDSPQTAYEIVARQLPDGHEESARAVGYGLEMTLSYLDHLAGRGEARIEDDGALVRWRAC